jgi:hypothetical protein
MVIAFGGEQQRAAPAERVGVDVDVNVNEVDQIRPTPTMFGLWASRSISS